MAMVCNSIQSSSSSSRMIRKYYDVFVSFRGKDTRYNFTSNLFGALQRKGIVAFRDDMKLKKGEPIAPELLQAIEGSQILIVIFSKNHYTKSGKRRRSIQGGLNLTAVSGKLVPVTRAVPVTAVMCQGKSPQILRKKRDPTGRKPNQVHRFVIDLLFRIRPRVHFCPLSTLDEFL